MEAESKKRARNAQIQRAILATVAIAGILAVGAVAPNAIQALKLLGVRPGSRFERDSVNRSRRRLIEAGLLAYTDKGFLKLTPKGETKLRHLELSDYRLKKPRRWDRKWRLLIFDIPEHRKGLRDKVRRTLARIGFQRLQNSVWVYPYDCEDLITLLKADFKIGRDLLYVIADTVEHDKVLREDFSLS